MSRNNDIVVEALRGELQTIAPIAEAAEVQAFSREFDEAQREGDKKGLGKQVIDLRGVSDNLSDRVRSLRSLLGQIESYMATLSGLHAAETGGLEAQLSSLRAMLGELGSVGSEDVGETQLGDHLREIADLVAAHNSHKADPIQVSSQHGSVSSAIAALEAQIASIQQQLHNMEMHIKTLSG